MRTVPAKTPSGDEWAVRVLWQPRWPLLVRRFGGWRAKRKANRDGDGADVPVDGLLDAANSPGGGGGGGGFDLGDGILVAIVVFVGLIVAAVLFWWVLLPLLLLFLDLLVILVLLVLAVVSRVLFRRPWIVEAVDGAGVRFIARVVGWRAALRARDEIAEALRSGQPARLITGLAAAAAE